MKRDELRLVCQQQMPSKRWEHTLGVIEASIDLAKRYGADARKAELAAIVHDYAKYWPVSDLRQVIIDEGLPKELLDYDTQLWHAPVGAFIAERDFAIDDLEVLDAIRFHTSGRENMTLLEKVVCLADYIEPGRSFPGVDHIRSLAEVSLNEALVACFDSTMSLLIQRKQRIYPLTVLARNDLLLKI